MKTLNEHSWSWPGHFINARPKCVSMLHITFDCSKRWLRSDKQPGVKFNDYHCEGYIWL